MVVNIDFECLVFLLCHVQEDRHGEVDQALLEHVCRIHPLLVNDHSVVSCIPSHEKPILHHCGVDFIEFSIVDLVSSIRPLVKGLTQFNEIPHGYDVEETLNGGHVADVCRTGGTW